MWHDTRFVTMEHRIMLEKSGIRAYRISEIMKAFAKWYCVLRLLHYSSSASCLFDVLSWHSYNFSLLRCCSDVCSFFSWLDSPLLNPTFLLHTHPNWFDVRLQSESILNDINACFQIAIRIRMFAWSALVKPIFRFSNNVFAIVFFSCSITNIHFSSLFFPISR